MVPLAGQWMLFLQRSLLGERFWYRLYSHLCIFSGFVHCAAGVVQGVRSLAAVSWRRYLEHLLYFLIIWQLLVAKRVDLCPGLVGLLLW